MTEREEAIIILDGFKNNPLFNEQHKQALDMAISALSAEPCEDCISRADVCEVLADMYPTDGEKVISYTEIDKAYKSCNTCKNNDDEFSGECYECLKGIFDHYEPEEEKAESEE